MSSQFDETIYQKMRDGIELFNQEQFWECHEALEHIWLEDSHDPIRLIYWAVIQVAATNIHVRDSNVTGAIGLLAKAKNKFTRIKEAHLENKFLDDVYKWQELKSLVFSIKENEEDLSLYQKLFVFRFPPYPQNKGL
ncbi:DUF309 domain-containing protein [Bacteriovoracaceae bacterium]|nr:DUF309 domain-containing protein [Bacteriovoracaceae bacterium]